MLAADAGHEILSDMIDRVTKGEDPAPPGYIERPPTQMEISEAATRIAAAKAATDKANATNARLANEKREADARKAAEEEAVNNAHHDLLQAEENRLLQAQQTIAAAQSEAQVAPMVQNILASIGRKAPTVLPVRTHPLPVIQQVPEASVDGTIRVDALEQAMKIAEGEKRKVTTYAEQLRLQREKEEITYNYDQDFSLLRACKMGKSNKIKIKPLLRICWSSLKK